MTQTLWRLPVPSTALLDGGPVLEKRAHREVALRMSYESDAGVQVTALVFEGVEAFKVTYDRARGDWMLEAYDRLLSHGESAWLGEISGNLKRHGGEAAALAHLMINFDDGPCYEVVCRSHRLDVRPGYPIP
jgi:hypothetical protein